MIVFTDYVLGRLGSWWTSNGADQAATFEDVFDFVLQTASEIQSLWPLLPTVSDERDRIHLVFGGLVPLALSVTEYGDDFLVYNIGFPPAGP